MDKKEKLEKARQMLAKHGYEDDEIALILGYAFDDKKFTGQTFTNMMAEGAPTNADNPRPEST